MLLCGLFQVMASCGHQAMWLDCAPWLCCVQTKGEAVQNLHEKQEECGLWDQRALGSDSSSFTDSKRLRRMSIKCRETTGKI